MSISRYNNKKKKPKIFLVDIIFLKYLNFLKINLIKMKLINKLLKFF